MEPIEKLDRAGLENLIDDIVKELGLNSRAELFQKVDAGEYKSHPRILTILAIRPILDPVVAHDASVRTSIARISKKYAELLKGLSD